MNPANPADPQTGIVRKNPRPRKPDKSQVAVLQMPPRKFYVPEPGRTPGEIGVIGWLIRQPEIQIAIFNHYRKKGCIAYNRETGLWVGIDYKEVAK